MQTRLVPLDLIFAKADSIPKIATSSAKPINTFSHSPLLPLVALKPHMDMIHYVLTGQGTFDSYWKWYTHNANANFVRKEECLKAARRRIKLLRWTLFFQTPTVSAIDRDRLILENGIETCCLAKFLGKTWIRVRMHSTVTEKWDKRPIKKLNQAIILTNRKGFYNPVHHKDFRKVKISRPESIRLDRIRCVINSFGQNLRGLDIGCNMGYLCHHMQRQGLNMTGIDFDEYHLIIAKALNNTYGLDVNFVKCKFSEYNTSKKYDIVFALTVLYHIFFSQKDSDILSIVKKVDFLTQSALFWESGDDPEKEKKYILSHTGLTKFLSLGPTEGTGLKRELGIFLRPETELSQLLLAQYKRHFPHFSVFDQASA